MMLTVLKQAISDKDFKNVVGRATTPAMLVHTATVRGTEGREWLIRDAQRIR